jgi:hypothetical protein
MNPGPGTDPVQNKNEQRNRRVAASTVSVRQHLITSTSRHATADTDFLSPPKRAENFTFLFVQRIVFGRFWGVVTPIIPTH